MVSHTSDTSLTVAYVPILLEILEFQEITVQCPCRRFHGNVDLPLRTHVSAIMVAECNRRRTTLSILGLLAGFVNIDAYCLKFLPTRVCLSSLADTQKIVARRGDASTSTWRSAPRRLSMSTLSATDDVAPTGERGMTPSQSRIMDDLDAILGDVQRVRALNKP